MSRGVVAGFRERLGTARQSPKSLCGVLERGAMRVGLYYPWIYLTSGAERVILELSGRSRHQWTLLTSHFAPEQTFPGFADRKVVELDRVPVDRSIGAV